MILGSNSGGLEWGWRSIGTPFSSPSWLKTQESTCLLRRMPTVSNTEWFCYSFMLRFYWAHGLEHGPVQWAQERKEEKNMWTDTNMHQNVNVRMFTSTYAYTHQDTLSLYSGKINQHTHTCNRGYIHQQTSTYTVLYTYCISGFFHSKTSPTGPTEQTPKKTWVSNNSSNFGVLQDSVPFNFWWSHTYRASQVTGNPAPASPRATSGSQVHFLMLIHHWFVVDIVDGSEIRRSLVDMVNWNIPLYTDYICGFYIYPRWCRISSINSMSVIF